MRIDAHRCASTKIGAWPTLVQTVSYLTARIADYYSQVAETESTDKAKNPNLPIDGSVSQIIIVICEKLFWYLKIRLTIPQILMISHQWKLIFFESIYSQSLAQKKLNIVSSISTGSAGLHA